MKVIDKTPFRAEDGSIAPMDRIQGMLKFGFDWFSRLEAQTKVLAVLEKALPQSYLALQNITLPDPDPEMELNLPGIVLVGQAGVFYLNILHESGVFRAREEEWGKIASGRFQPSRNNQLLRTQRIGKAVQLYLEKAGLKGMITVEPILITANPLTHVESVRPIVRIVMGDALERFAASLSQGARSSLGPEMVAAVGQILLTGKGLKQPKAAAPASAAPAPEAASPAAASEASSEALTFDFKEEEPALEQAPQLHPAPKTKSKRIWGMTKQQLALIAGFGLAEFCLAAAVLGFIIINSR